MEGLSHVLNVIFQLLDAYSKRIWLNKEELFIWKLMPITLQSLINSKQIQDINMEVPFLQLRDHSLLFMAQSL